MTTTAIVTGASRGAGRGIAIGLGRAGMTVYVTGRSTDSATSEYGASINETAEMVTQAGGKGIAVALDHGDDKAVAAFFERVSREAGKLDILVNNAAKVLDPKPGGFWEKPLETVDLITIGLRSHYVASYYAAPLLLKAGRSLIVNTGYYGAVSYHLSPAYGAQKAGADKMAADMALELRSHDVSAVSIWMGGLDTERARAFIAGLPEASRPKSKRESPEFTGRVIAAFYASDLRMQLSGRALIGAELGAILDVTDADGSRPVSQRYRLGSPPEPHSSLLAPEMKKAF